MTSRLTSSARTELSAATAGALPEIVLPDEHDSAGAHALHYLDWGSGLPPVVFLHGGGLNAHTWTWFASRCAASDCVR